MSATCFMVDNVMQCWDDGGVRVGAMCWRLHEYESYDTERRPMPHLGVMTAAGLVCLDCPATDPPHGYWSRSGEPPLITVTPSLNVDNDAWHGFLQNGELTP